MHPRTLRSETGQPRDQPASRLHTPEGCTGFTTSPLDADILKPLGRYIHTYNLNPRQTRRLTEVDHRPDSVQPAEWLLVPVKYHGKGLNP
jgi:hypothetical protein